MTIRRRSRLKGNQIVTNSRDVATYFEKRHDNVMRDVGRLIFTAPDCALNFEETSNQVQMPRGGTREDVSYDMTRVRIPS